MDIVDHVDKGQGFTDVTVKDTGTLDKTLFVKHDAKRNKRTVASFLF